MPSINQVQLAGHLARDPELRFTPSGKAVCEFTMAINTRFGEAAEETAWIRVTAWGGWAESAGKLKKGEAVMVLGRLRTESWESKKEAGKTESRTSVTANSLYRLPKDEAAVSGQPEAKSAPRAKPAPASMPVDNNRAPADDSSEDPF